MSEELLLEYSRWIREAEAATVAKLAALQLGEAFTEQEESNDPVLSTSRQ